MVHRQYKTPSPCAQLKESTDSNPKRGASRLRLLRPHRETVICTRYTCSTEIVKERMLKKEKF